MIKSTDTGYLYQDEQLNPKDIIGLMSFNGIRDGDEWLVLPYGYILKHLEQRILNTLYPSILPGAIIQVESP